MPNCYWPLSFTLSPLGHSLSTILPKKFNENHMKPMHFTVRWFLSSELNEILWKKSWARRFQLLQEMPLAGPWICQSPPWLQKDPLSVNPTALRNFQSLITVILGWWSRRVHNWWVRGGNKKWRSRNIPKTWTLSLRRWMIPSKPTVLTNGLSRTMVWAGLYEGLWLCITLFFNVDIFRVRDSVPRRILRSLYWFPALRDAEKDNSILQRLEHWWVKIHIGCTKVIAADEENVEK